MINTYIHNPQQLIDYAEGNTSAFLGGLDIGLSLGENNPPKQFSSYGFDHDTTPAELALSNYID